MSKRILRSTNKSDQADVPLTQEEVPMDLRTTDNPAADDSAQVGDPVAPPLHDPGPRSPSAAIELDVGNVSEADDLEEYAGPQPTHLVDTAVKVIKATLDLPTFKPYAAIVVQDLNLVSRRHVALEFGATAFAKPFLRDPKPVSRKLRVGTFRNELANLHSVITSVEVAQLVDEGGHVYRLQKGPYWTLWKQLDELRKRISAPPQKTNVTPVRSPSFNQPIRPLREPTAPPIQPHSVREELDSGTEREPATRKNLRKPWVEEVSDEDDGPFERASAPPEAFGKSATPPSKFHDAFSRIKFESDLKSGSRFRSKRAREYLAEVARADGQRRDLPPHLSNLGFAIPNHSSRPSESNHLKQSRPTQKSTNPGAPDSDGDPSDSGDDDGRKKGWKERKFKSDSKGSGRPPKGPGRIGGDPDEDPSSSDEDDDQGPRRGIPRASRKPSKKSTKAHDENSTGATSTCG
ncbi:hypothetical protein GGX14DRAFT_406535 [Mycena pura]|uniref:Uncharacterized protein n=1 Tax=Mycena pura TaxID=153505 RepID=A0AAD6UUA7_9AGAR|nr:hypothetical protein GGX14DRAFT_406535 [Mycena pura]